MGILLDDIKTALRISGNDLDGEILDLIEAAKADLILSGVHESKAEDTDPLIKRAIIVYCKAHFGYEDPAQAELFLRSYLALKAHLALSKEYAEAVTP